MKGDKNRCFCNRLITIAFIAMICVPLVLFAIWVISGIFIIAYEDELYAKELNNPYVDCDFEGWHVEFAEHGSIILPENWEMLEENKTMHLLHNGKNIGLGTLVNDHDTLFQTKEAFLSRILKTDVAQVHCINLHGLLGSSFGKLDISEHKEFQGYYLDLFNDDGSSLVFYFPSAEHTESELKSIAEAIIYYHNYQV